MKTNIETKTIQNTVKVINLQLAPKEAMKLKDATHAAIGLLREHAPEDHVSREYLQLLNQALPSYGVIDELLRKQFNTDLME